MCSRASRIPHFPFGMAGDPTIGVQAIQASSKLHPHGFWLVEHIFERNGGPHPAVTKHKPNGCEGKDKKR